MRVALRRELSVMLAAPGVWTASILQLLVLGSFVLIWGNGLPLHDGPSLPEQFGLIQTTLACVLLPWTTLRCTAPRGAHGMTRLALVTAIPAQQLMLARLVAAAAALALVVLTALPLMAVVQQVSARTLAETANALRPPLALAGVAAVMACLASVLIRGDVPAWIMATLATGAVAILPGDSTATSAGLALAGMVLLPYWARRRLDYLPAPAPSDAERERPSPAPARAAS